MTIPTEIVNDIMLSVASIFNACQPLILIIFGTGIVFFIAKNIQAILPKGR